MNLLNAEEGKEYIIDRIEAKIRPKKGDLYDLALEDKSEIDAIIASLDAVPFDKQGEHFAQYMKKLTQSAKQAEIDKVLEEIKTATPEQQVILKQQLLKLLNK